MLAKKAGVINKEWPSQRPAGLISERTIVSYPFARRIQKESYAHPVISSKIRVSDLLDIIDDGRVAYSGCLECTNVVVTSADELAALALLTGPVRIVSLDIALHDRTPVSDDVFVRALQKLLPGGNLCLGDPLHNTLDSSTAWIKTSMLEKFTKSCTGSVIETGRYGRLTLVRSADDIESNKAQRYEPLIRFMQCFNQVETVNTTLDERALNVLALTDGGFEAIKYHHLSERNTNGLAGYFAAARNQLSLSGPVFPLNELARFAG
ncbi:hypothetical protein EBR96_07335, partial [bacterium]|nr:hypothetical protein [bacterium]